MISLFTNRGECGGSLGIACWMDYDMVAVIYNHSPATRIELDWWFSLLHGALGIVQNFYWGLAAATRINKIVSGLLHRNWGVGGLIKCAVPDKLSENT